MSKKKLLSSCMFSGKNDVSVEERSLHFLLGRSEGPDSMGVP